MKDKVNKVIEKFDALPIRSRLIYTFAAMTLLALLIDSVWIAPSMNKNQQLSEQIEQIDRNLNDLIQAQESLNQKVSNQNNDPQKLLLAQNQQEIDSLKANLEEKTFNLVKPEKIPGLLKAIVKQFNGLTLKSLTNLPPVNLFENQPNDPDQVEIKVYRHAFVLTMNGSFNETKTFLHQLESLEQKVNFESLDFTVEDYPDAVIKLTISTLSLQEAWIGG